MIETRRWKNLKIIFIQTILSFVLSRKVIIMLKNYDELVEINHNPNWPYVLDHSYRILINVGSGSGKTNVSLNLIKNQRSDNNKIYLPI